MRYLTLLVAAFVLSSTSVFGQSDLESTRLEPNTWYGLYVWYDNLYGSESYEDSRYGVRSIMMNSDWVTGMMGYARSSLQHARGVEGFGVGARATGVMGKAYSEDGVAAGVYGVAWGAAPYAGYFLGDVKVTGDIIETSSATVKQEVQRLQGTGILEKVKQLRPVSFSYESRGGLPGGRHFGLIAEELKSVFPEVVREVHDFEVAQPDPLTPEAGPPDRPQAEVETYAGIDYQEFIAILLQAVQDQQTQIEALEERVEQLERRP